MTLTADLISRIIVSISHLLFEVEIWMHFGVMKCHIPFWGHCDHDLDL